MTQSTAPEVIPIGECIARFTDLKPDTPALICGDTTRTWSDLDRRSNRIGRALRSRGADVGSMVTIGLPNSVEFIEACIACWKIGAIPQPVSSRLPVRELEAIVELAEPVVVIANADVEIGTDIVDVDTLVGESDDDSRFEWQISPSWKAPTSGGSTGRPKLIVAGSPGVTTAAASGLWRHEPDGVALMPGPLYHNGPFSSLFAGLFQGSTVIVMTRFDAEETLRLVDRHGATWVYLVPAMMGRIWRLPEDVRASYDVSSLRTVWHLAAPCPPWLKQAWIEWLGPEVIWELYAGTEAQAGTVISGAEWLEHRGSVGKVTFGEMAILDDDGNPLPPGDVGEVWLKRPAGSPETYRYVGAQARRRGEWESLGDVGWMDADGYLYLADRQTDMILVGGANVYPAEVESALEEHPLIASSCVIGLPDDDLGNVVHAIVCAPADLDLDHVRRHLDERLVRYKQPRTFEIVDQMLRDDAGKVRRSQLREERLKTRTTS